MSAGAAPVARRARRARPVAVRFALFAIVAALLLASGFAGAVATAAPDVAPDEANAPRDAANAPRDDADTPRDDATGRPDAAVAEAFAAFPALAVLLGMRRRAASAQLV